MESYVVLDPLSYALYGSDTALAWICISLLTRTMLLFHAAGQEGSLLWKSPPEDSLVKQCPPSKSRHVKCHFFEFVLNLCVLHLLESEVNTNMVCVFTVTSFLVF